MKSVLSTRIVLAAAVLGTSAMHSAQAAAPGVEGATSMVHKAIEPVPALAIRFRHSAVEEFPGNAALNWSQVIAAASWDADMNRTIDEMLDAGWNEFDRDRAERVLGQHFDPLANMVYIASRRDMCDWGTSFREQGIGTMMPELGRLRTLAKLIQLKARLYLHDGNMNGALSCIRDGFELSRDLGRSRTAVQMLVSLTVAKSMYDEVAVVASRPEAPSLYWALSDLPHPFVSLGEVSLYEESMIDFMLPSLREVEGMSPDDPRAAALSAKAVEDLAELLGTSGANRSMQRAATAAKTIGAYPAARDWMVSTGLSAKKVESLPVSFVVTRHELHLYRVGMQSAMRWVSLAYPEAEKGLLEAMKRREEEPSQSLASFLPSVERMAGSVWGQERQIAVLRLVEAVRLHLGTTGSLPKSLDAITVVPVPSDPITGRPFQYRVEGEEIIIAGPAIRVMPDAQPLERRIRIVR